MYEWLDKWLNVTQAHPGGERKERSFTLPLSSLELLEWSKPDFWYHVLVYHLNHKLNKISNFTQKSFAHVKIFFPIFMEH